MLKSKAIISATFQFLIDLRLAVMSPLLFKTRAFEIANKKSNN